jgi:serine/threonine protein kinase
VDFIGKCLVWDPERRIKPQAAMRHPFITAGRRTRVVNSSSVTAKTLLSSSSLGNRVKGLTETPKKSQISAPTPLTARSSRITSAAVPSTPNNSSMHSATFGSSSRSYRTSQSQGLSYHSSRTLNGFAVRTVFLFLIRHELNSVRQRRPNRLDFCPQRTGDYVRPFFSTVELAFHTLVCCITMLLSFAHPSYPHVQI